MGSVVIPDRGPTPYFHGRTEIIDTFNRYINHYKSKQKGGTTFLIQGAPGAGKTALLDVLSAEARPQNWKVVSIKVKDLHDPISMAQSLGESYVMDKQYTANVGIHGFGGGYSRDVAGYSSVDGLLKEETPEEGLILVLDEAQYLINLNETPSEKHVARDTLKIIHNGELGKPAMLLTAGLSTSESALRSLGISRFVRDCAVGLGALGTESERAVIRDWLVKEGGAKGDPTLWIDTIAKKCHGWPQHILSYMDPAVAYLEAHDHRMTDEGLRIVLEKGHDFRVDYYETRAREFSLQQRRVIGSFIAKYQPDEYFEKEDLMAILDAKYGQEPASKFFNDLLHSGILHKQDGGVYGVPIPSMQTWLIEEYGKERNLPPLREPVEKPMGSKFSMER